MKFTIRWTFTNILLVLLCSVAALAQKPTVDDISVDLNDPRVLIVHFAPPVPSPGDIIDKNAWNILAVTAVGTRRFTVVGVDVSHLNNQEATRAGLNVPGDVDGTARLQLTDELAAFNELDVVLVGSNWVLIVPPDVVTPPASPPSRHPVQGATDKSDSDIYFNGSYKTTVNGDSTWNLDTFAGYMYALQKERTFYGKIGFYGQATTDKEASADPDSFLAYLVFQRVLGRGGWWWFFQSPYMNLRLAGTEFDRQGKQLNLISSPVLTFPFRLSGKFSGPLEPGLTFPHMTLQLGTEFVKVEKSETLSPQKNWYTRGLLGATFAAGYAPEKTYMYSIQLTSAYQVRIPSSGEIYFDDRLAPIDPATGKKGSAPALLGTQARHYLDTKFTYNLVKWAGITFEHSYGSQPPLFSRTDHSFSLGFTFSLKQTSYGRYSILKP